MEVTLIASTEMRDWPKPNAPQGDPCTECGNRGEAPEHVCEFGGRLCYQSWDKPNPKTATLQGYIDNIIDHEHFSVLEHLNATLLIRGVSRDLTHELVRHRHLSYSMESMRYVPATEDSRAVIPPALRGTDFELDLIQLMKNSVLTYKRIVAGISGEKKRKREAARAVLPGSLSTEILVTGNLRAWRHVLKMRGSVHADLLIRELAVEIANVLKAEWPIGMKDVTIDEENSLVTVGGTDTG